MILKYHSGIYSLQSEQILPISLKKAWDFFSSPKNLDEITPEKMGFKITSKIPERAFPGAIITYKIGILPGIKSNWVTEITHVQHEHSFVDEQRFGPYTMWHHIHTFEEHPEGVLMKDTVYYKLPFGPLGHMAHRLFIKKMLINIFSYRKEKLETVFPKQ